MTEIDEITVQYVNQPKEGKKWGSIKSAEGISYFGPPALLREFRAGEVCKIEFKPGDEKFNGKTIVKKVGFSGPPKAIERPPTNSSDSDRMATMGMVNQFIARGDIASDEDAIAELINRCYAGLKKSRFGNGAQRQADDEIPY